MIFKYFLPVFLIIVLIGCNKKIDNCVMTLNEKLDFSPAEYELIFKNHFISIDGFILRQDSILQYYDTLKYFYRSKEYLPLFVKDFEDSATVYSFIDIISKARDHGLNPEQYHLSSIKAVFEKATDTIPNDSRYYQLAMSELLISDAILKYGHDLRYGIVNPKEIFPDSYFLSYDDTSKGDLLEPLRQENVVNYLNEIQPKSERYVKLQKALKYFKKFGDFEWTTISPMINKIELGTRDATVPAIVDKLIKLEYLDTTKVRYYDPLLYDSLIVEAMKKFQLNNGLNPDGVIGKNTVERLNVSPRQYINEIKLNLERFRWNSYSDTSQYILVNIPDFRLFIVDNGKKIFETKVCAGSKKSASYEERMKLFNKTKKWKDKPDDWETPQMSSKISYLVLNPTWNVPQSIMREEIVYKMKRDSTYLNDHNFKVYLNDEEINADSITIKDLMVEKVPYKIVQDPGAGNALGKIKFIFNNPFGIYLHDTPNRPPFKSDNRAVSHGCIRVERPIPVTEFLLRDHPKWNIDFLKIEIGLPVVKDSVMKEYANKRESLRKFSSLGQTTDITLSKKVPVYIDYYTAWVDDEGTTQFRADVYDRDKKLIQYLAANSLL